MNVIIEYQNSQYIIDIEQDFFIDASNINNLRGSEDIIINPELKKKKVTKITEICDADGFVYSVCFNDHNKKEINYNNENKLINTGKHDSKCIAETLNNINENIKMTNITLIGDKGYKTAETFTINDEEIILITPNKKNQKKNLINRHQRKKLGYRHIVENSINGWKHKERVNLRKDKTITAFSGWVHLSILRHNLQINKIKQSYI